MTKFLLTQFHSIINMAEQNLTKTKKETIKLHTFQDLEELYSVYITKTEDRDSIKRAFEYMLSKRGVSSWKILSSNYTVTLKNPNTVFSKVQKAHSLSLEAISAHSGGYKYLCHSKWRELYGAKFPNS